MADLDYRILLGSRPIPSVAEQRDQQQVREIQQQEIELRRQAILARRDELRERGMPKPKTAAEQKAELEYGVFKSELIADRLKRARENPSLYPQTRQWIAETVGDAHDLPEQFDQPTLDAIIATGERRIAETKGTLQKVTTLGGPDGKTPVERFIVPKEGDEYAVVPKAETGGAPNIGSFEDYVLRTYGETPTSAQIIAARQTWARSDDAPGGGGSRLWVNRNGQTLRVAESEIRPGDTPMSTREQGRAVTSGDAGRIADFDTSLNDLTTLKATIPAGTTGARAKVGASLPNFVTEATGWGETAKSKQAVIDRVKQVIGKALEGGVLRKEDEYKYEKILPTIGDVDSVVKSKLNGLEAAIRQRRQTTFDALEDAGYDTSRFKARTATGGGGGVTVVAPNGKTYSFPNQAQADVFKKRAGIP